MKKFSKKDKAAIMKALSDPKFVSELEAAVESYIRFSKVLDKLE